MDQHSRSHEARDDDTEPEESHKTFGGGDVDEAVYGRGLQELLDSLHGGGRSLTEL